jgi:hypothetical protein
MASRKANETIFKRGRRKTGGRKPGTRNKITADLGDDFLAAAEVLGYDGRGKDGRAGYIRHLAEKYPPVYAKGLIRMMPQKIETKITSRANVVYRSSNAIRDELLRRNVPVDMIYPALTDATDATDETDKTDKTDDKIDKTDDDPGEQQR